MNCYVAGVTAGIALQWKNVSYQEVHSSLRFFNLLHLCSLGDFRAKMIIM